MRVAYVAGPYRAPTVRGIVENIRAAEAVALELWKREFAVICPHKNTALFDGAAPDETWLGGDLELLRRSDFVVLVEGWSESRGARVERFTAKALNIPVYERGNQEECFELGMRRLAEAKPESYQEARGIVPIGPNGLTPEEAIRRGRGN